MLKAALLTIQGILSSSVMLTNAQILQTAVSRNIFHQQKHLVGTFLSLPTIEQMIQMSISN